MAETRIRSDTSEGELYERVWVSDLRVETDLWQLDHHGYQQEGVILPSNIRKPTDEELEAIIAPRGYEGPTFDICRIPKELGRKALLLSRSYTTPSTKNPNIEIADDIQGTFMAVQSAEGNLDVATCNKKKGRRVGYHIDIRPPDRFFIGGNLGPGGRYVTEVPSVTADVVGDISSVALGGYVRELLAAGESPLAYFFKLRATTDADDYYEGYVNLDSGGTLHEGSTYNESEPSSAFYYLTHGTIPLDTFPSLLVPEL